MTEVHDVYPGMHNPDMQVSEVWLASINNVIDFLYRQA